MLVQDLMTTPVKTVTPTTSLAEVASLMVRLARLQENQLADVEAARQTLEQALRLQPKNPEVLQALTDLFLGQETWPEYVATLLRLVDVGVEGLDAVQALMSAAVLMQERVNDREKAILLCERALEHDPSHLPAVNMLLGLCRDDLQRQEPFLRLKKELEHEPLPSGNYTQERIAKLLIHTNHDIGSGDNAPRLYYRVNEGSFNVLQPVSTNQDTFFFTIRRCA